jgi:2-methylisocitrate lyase-like PEP mutase family enzyme
VRPHAGPPRDPGRGDGPQDPGRREARRSPDFLFVARTDARTAHGLDEAIRRGRLYAEAGADVVFIESPESEAEMAEIGRSVGKPLLANMVEGGRTPILPAERLAELGYAIAIYPAVGFLAAAAALERAYAHLNGTATATACRRRKATASAASAS